jgi:FkbM family methyltransferase
MDNKVVKVKNLDFIVKDQKEKIQSLWMQGRFYETQRNGLLAYMFANKYHGNKVLEIGANIGNHPIYYAGVLGCEVVAIEPVKACYDHMKENLAINNIKMETHNVALGMCRKMVSMVNLSEGKNVGMYNVCSGADSKMVMLDDIVSGQFDVIKIDVENYNEEVLIGGSNFFVSQKTAHVFIECESAVSLKNTDWLMHKYGYERRPVKLNATPTYLWAKK